MSKIKSVNNKQLPQTLKSVVPAKSDAKNLSIKAGLSKGKDLQPVDSLSTYMREIRAFPRLSREEELDLAIKFYNDKDREAAYKLLTSNLWLVVKIAREYERAARNVLDLIQEGNIGLMEAIKNFDPFRNVRFPSYAVWWIKAYIIRYVIANWRMVKIGTTQAQRKLFFNLTKEKERLERDGFFPTTKLLADKLNVREKDVIEMEQRLNNLELSVDAPLPGENSSSLLSVLPSDNESAEDILAEVQRLQLMHSVIDSFKESLKEREKVVLERRLLAEDKATLQDLSEELSISRERVRQIENRIKEKLKRHFTEELGDNLSEVIEVE
jgi:RNA polymerase sigma-32 factor